MSNLHISMTRVAYVTTENTGGSLDIAGPEGIVQLRRVDPHGVILMFEGRQLSIRRELLPILGRFFYGASMALGDADKINDGWDSPEGTQAAGV